jgi:hypothetical protein
LAARALGTGGEGLEAVELAIRTAMTTLGASLLGQLLAAESGHCGQRIDCGAGHQAEFVSYRDKTIDTVLGPVALRRAYYHCAACGHGVVPRDDELDVAGSSTSPGLAKMIARVGAAAPFAQAASLLAELAGVHLNAKRVERVAEADGAAAAVAIEARADAIAARTLVPLPPAPLPDMLYAAMDGTGVPTIPAENEGRTGKAEDARARTREVKLACLFTQTTVTDDGHPIRDPESTSYLATFAPAAQFAGLLHAEVRRRGADHVRQLVVLGDGAAWIWKLATQIMPAATQIVDLYHAREHLHDLAERLAFMLGGDHPGWLAERLADLDRGDITAITTAATKFPLVGVKADDRDKALAYFHTNAHRMRYAHFRDLGMFIGSGAVEAGCKAVIGQRLKLSGMRWSVPGATGILTLRCQQASHRWDEIWQRPHNQTQLADLATCGT